MQHAIPFFVQISMHLLLANASTQKTYTATVALLSSVCACRSFNATLEKMYKMPSFHQSGTAAFDTVLKREQNFFIAVLLAKFILFFNMLNVS